MKIIGIGNEQKGDGGVGLVVCRVLKTRKMENVEIIEMIEGVGGTEVTLRSGMTEKVILVGAVQSSEKKKAGTIYRYEDVDAFLKLVAIPLPDVVVEALKRHDVIAYGIEGDFFDEHLLLSHEVAEAARNVIDQIVDELKS